MSNLLSLSFWFNMRPGYLMPFYQRGLIFFLIFLVVLWAASLIIKSRKKGLFINVWRQVSIFSIANIAIGLILLFFNYELIPFLSARFWFLLWAVGIVVWLSYVLKKVKKIPERKKQLEEEKEYRKYIP